MVNRLKDGGTILDFAARPQDLLRTLSKLSAGSYKKQPDLERKRNLPSWVLMHPPKESEDHGYLSNKAWVSQMRTLFLATLIVSFKCQFRTTWNLSEMVGLWDIFLIVSWCRKDTVHCGWHYSLGWVLGNSATHYKHGESWQRCVYLLFVLDRGCGMASSLSFYLNFPKLLDHTLEL